MLKELLSGGEGVERTQGAQGREIGVGGGALEGRGVKVPEEEQPG